MLAEKKREAEQKQVGRSVVAGRSVGWRGDESERGGATQAEAVQREAELKEAVAALEAAYVELVGRSVGRSVVWHAG